ncbi:Panacea domain-containing protein [Mucilaginibacter aquatilis]|uniref:DUF4065 domain-containing protein n=1 Tax=Mucilaginibacter aquatilis TaxID=1517760 RepID=A0A6I4I5X8_9SPHI|nr:Panacea domain-containing protein [Mucilaginibacter aquatilis]MVN90481.1 DUF4065 domain-containing protein [Mucilaginibacter aquatilis]
MSNSFKFKKSVQSVTFFAQKEGGTINYMKAGKLVYLADKLHLRKYGRSITNDTYVAMKNGPVPSRTKDIILKSEWFGHDIVEYSNMYLTRPEGYNISSIGELESKVFSQTDLALLEQVYNEYGHLNEFDLSDYTHTFPEWKRFESQLTADRNRAFPIISDDLFLPLNSDRTLSQNEELLAMSKEVYQNMY